MIARSNDSDNSEPDEQYDINTSMKDTFFINVVLIM